MVDVGEPLDDGGGGASTGGFRTTVEAAVDERGGMELFVWGGNGRSILRVWIASEADFFACSNAPIVAVDVARRPIPSKALTDSRSIWMRRKATSIGTRIASAIKNQSKIGFELRLGARPC